MFSAPSAPRNPLFVPELFRSILGFLAEPSSSESPASDDEEWHGVQVRVPDLDGRRALACIAQTCKKLSEPALDQLWQRLKSLRPLLRSCFSAEAVDDMTDDLRPPSAAQWGVISRHCCRVQELAVKDTVSGFLLECASFESNLLPNLRVLKFYQCIEHIQPLLTPRLLVLDLRPLSVDKGLGLASFLKICPLLCPGLKSVKFHMHGIDDPTKESLSEFLRQFDNLERLVLEADVEDALLKHILASPKFKEVYLRVRSTSAIYDFPVPPSETPLRIVQKLDLPIWRLHFFVKLLRPHDQAFREVSFDIQDLTGSAHSILSLFAKLASSPRKTSLESIHLASRSSLDDEDLAGHGYVLSHDAFQPLLSFSNLLDLRLNLPNPVSLTNQELGHMARHWPSLQVFELCRTQGLSLKNKSITFDGLLSLVAVCPELNKVGLTLDATTVPQGTPVRPGSHKITTLSFPYSPIDSPGDVAPFLSTHFPSVTGLAAYTTRSWMSPDPYEERWMRVDSYLAGAIGILGLGYLEYLEERAGFWDGDEEFTASTSVRIMRSRRCGELGGSY